MRSISGVRGLVGKDLTPEVVARYAAAFGHLVRGDGTTVVVARDSRTSGTMFADAVAAGLASVGSTVVDCGMIPTPSAQLAVEHHKSAGGIIITASHNPVEWNALKFVGADGLFLDRERVGQLFVLADGGMLQRASWDAIGAKRSDSEAVDRHIEAVLALPYVDVAGIRAKHFRVALDCVRGAGGPIMSALLGRLGCHVVGVDLETDGRFPRAPEPIPANLSGLAEAVRRYDADLGMAVDPDADRLALVDEQGTPIGEDYTLAFAVRAVLERRVGPVAVNLSTSLVVDDAARSFGLKIARAPVGEANVARRMQDIGAVIGGEGNGGVMLPELHVGRDAPVAAALTLDLLARSGSSVRALVDAAPRYVIVKAKAPRGGVLENVYADLERDFADADIDRQDGLRLSWGDRWLHVRPSGTEPIVRFIAEAPTAEVAHAMIEAGKDRFRE